MNININININKNKDESSSGDKNGSKSGGDNESNCLGEENSMLTNMDENVTGKSRAVRSRTKNAKDILLLQNYI